MKEVLCLSICVALVGVAPALGGTDPWMDGWYANGDLGCTGITGANMTTFAPNDPRLGGNVGNNGTTSGGIAYAYAEHGKYNGGDNARVLMNMDMTVPAGEYYFEVDLDSLIYWDQYGTGQGVDQAWGLYQEWYLGDEADMDYGNWTQGAVAAPPGPWKGGSWGDNNYTQLGRYSNGSNQDPVSARNDQSGIWRHWNFTQTTDPVNTIVTNGTITFRAFMRLKDDNTYQASAAMDNLVIKLTPVTGGDPIIFTDDFLPEPATALLMALAAPLLLRRRR